MENVVQKVGVAGIGHWKLKIETRNDKSRPKKQRNRDFKNEKY